MCDGAAFLPAFQWDLLTGLSESGFKPEVPNAPGVYCLWAQQVGITDTSQILRQYEDTRFMKALKELAAASKEHFRSTGLAHDYGWGKWDAVIGFDRAMERVSRLSRIATSKGQLDCPVLYLGRSGKLRTRLDQLAFGGHTANHSVWPRLIFGWSLNIGWKQVPDHSAEEARLKNLYRGLHNGSLPPLMDR